MELSNITIGKDRIYISGVPVAKVAGLEETIFSAPETAINEVHERDQAFVVYNKNSGFWVRMRLDDYLESLCWLYYSAEVAQ